MASKAARRVAVVALAIAVCAGAAVAIAAIIRDGKGVATGPSAGIVVYSPHPRDMVEYIVKEFRQRTGIQVRVVYAGTGELIERIRREGRASEGDVLWGGGVESLETAKDCFRAYRGMEDGSINPAYKSSSGLWSPFSVLPAVIMYNTKLVPEPRRPKSWSSLLDPYFDGRIIMADPQVSGSSFTALVTMLVAMARGGGGPYSGWDYVEGLVSQLGEGGLVTSSTAAYSAVANGDYFATVTSENSALNLKKSGALVAVCYPSEGTSAVPDGIALIARDGSGSDAERFFDFVLSRDVQSLLMTRWQRRSVRADIPGSSPEADRIKLVPYRIEEVAALRGTILSRWIEAEARRRP